MCHLTIWERESRMKLIQVVKCGVFDGRHSFGTHWVVLPDSIQSGDLRSQDHASIQLVITHFRGGFEIYKYLVISQWSVSQYEFVCITLVGVMLLNTSPPGLQ